MVVWLIFSAVTIFITGALAYCYYKLLNFFIRKHVERYPEIAIVEPAVQRVTFPFLDEDSDSDEKRTNLFKEINNVDMKIHRA